MMSKHQEVPLVLPLPDYLSLGNGLSATEPNARESSTMMSTIEHSTGATSSRDNRSGEKVPENIEIEAPSQQFNYRINIQKQLDVVSRHLELFSEQSKSILDVAGNFCKSAELAAEVVRKNFDALAAELAGNQELLLNTIETRRKNVVCKLEQRASDIAKAKCRLQHASEIAEKALFGKELLESQYDNLIKALEEATSMHCTCLVQTPEPDPLHVAFDGDSLLILKSQIQRFSAVEGGTVDMSCKCGSATPLRHDLLSLSQSTTTHRPSILLTPSRKRLNNDTNRSKSVSKVVRINSDKLDLQEEALNEQGISDEPIGHMTARKSTSGKLDVCLPKFRRFRRRQESQDSSSVTESSRESSAETSTSNETIEMQSPFDSPNTKSPILSPWQSAESLKESEDSKKAKTARFAPPKFEPIPLRTRSAIGKQPVGRPRKHTVDHGKPVECALRRVDLDNVIPQRRRPASVTAATELQQGRLHRLTSLSTEDEDDGEKQLAAVIALSAVEVQNPPKRTAEADKDKLETKDSTKDHGKDSVMLINTKPNPVQVNTPPVNPPVNPPPNPKLASEQPQRLLARKSAGPQVKLEDVGPEINNIREVPVYHTCTDTYGIFYVHLYYKPVHPCVLCLKCKETLATFQFATHSHSNDPKRCSTKKWRHCVKLKYPDNKEHEVIFQRLKDRFGHKNPRGSGGGKKANPDNSPSKDEKKQKKKKTMGDPVDYLPYPSIVETSEDLTRFVRRIGEPYTGHPEGPRPKPGELICVVPPVNEYDGQPWIGQLMNFTNLEEKPDADLEVKWLRGTYSQPWTFEKRQRFMTGKVPLDSVAYFGFTLRPNGRLYTATVEYIRHELEETDDAEPSKDKS